MVAFPAGGSTDIAARIVASIAEKALGQPIVVVNKGGAGGQVGWTEMVRQRPDGYYIGFINLPATNTVILDPERKAIFTEKDFTPIINQVLDPGVIWVKGGQPLQDRAGPDRCGQEIAEHDPRRHHRHPLGRPSRHPDDRGGGARRKFPHRAPRGRRGAVQGDHGRQHRRRLRQCRQRRAPARCARWP